MSNNRISVYAGPGFFGPWYTSGPIILGSNLSYDFNLDFTTVSDPPSAYEVEIRYFNGNDFVTETIVNTADQSVNVTVQGGVDGSISSAQFRLKSFGPALNVTADPGPDISVLPGRPPEADVPVVNQNGEEVPQEVIPTGVPPIPSQKPPVPEEFGNLPIDNVPGFNIGAGFGGGGGLDPLVFDLDGDGMIELTNLDTNSIHFDFWDDGYAESTGWVAPDDGMLVWDIDGSGDINAVAEMFGSGFPIGFIVEDDFGAFIDEENGFARLGKQDLAINGGNEDGIIDAGDTIWTQLNIWQDINQDGVSQASELLSLDSLGIASIDVTNFALDSFVGILAGGFTRIIEGNTVTHTGIFTMNDSSTREVVDVWFNADLQDTYYSEDYTLDVRTLFLPTLRGYGQVSDLHIAMSQDNGTGGLLEQVQSFAGGRTFEQLFGEFDTVRTDMRDIALKWAGIDEAAIAADIAYEDHGLYAYMPEFYFLRKLAGIETEFLGSWFDLTPYLPTIDQGVESIFDSWNNVLDSLSARLIFQSGGAALFDPGASYNPISDVFEGTLTLSQTVITQLQAEATGHSNVEGFWHSVAQFIDSTKGVGNLTAGEETWLDVAVDASSASSLSWADIESTLGDQIITVQSTDTLVTGSDYDDVFDQYWLVTGNLESIGGAGNDQLFGWYGDDILDGGAGNDILRGSSGNDIYRYDFGHDVIVEPGGNSPAIDTDIIEFGVGINVSDVTLHYARQDTGFITGQTILDVQGRGTVTIVQSSAVSSDFIDELHFTDGTVVNFSDVDTTFHGTDEDDYLTPQVSASNETSYFYGYGGNDTITAQASQLNIIDGGAGNDLLNGYFGDDIYVISEGNDYILFAGGGADKIYVPTGYTLSDVSFYRVDYDDSPYVGSTRDAMIDVNGLGSITIKSQFDSLPNNTVSTLEFADGTIIDLLSQDYIVTGTPGDDLYGSLPTTWPTQSETFIFGQGNDTIQDFGGGDDTLLFGPGIDFSSLILERKGGFDGENLFIADGVGNSFTVTNHFGSVISSIEHLKFDDGSIVNLSDIEVDAYGTELGETLNGKDFGDASPDDILYGLGGDDTINAFDGDDIIYGGEGNDYLNGGDGTDEAVFSGAFGDYTITDNINNFTVEDTIGTDGIDTLVDVERFVFFDGTYENGVFTSIFPAGSIVGNSGANTLTGSGGNNFIYGLGGDDILNGKLGDDTLYGGDGDDILQGKSDNDTLIGEAGNDTLSGSGGTDEAVYVGAWANYTVTDNGSNITVIDNVGNEGTDTLTSVEKISFSDGSYENGVFTPTGGGGNNPPVAQNDNFTTDQDIVINGNLLVDNGNGVDSDPDGDPLNVVAVTTLATTNGGTVDILANGDFTYTPATGFTGSDSFAYTLEDGQGGSDIGTVNLTVNGAFPPGSIVGTANADSLTGSGGNNFIYGLGGDDILNGKLGDDTLYGGDGNDILQGKSDNDTLIGEAGNDTLSGSGGNDVLYGGDGLDTLVGGGGADIFHFESASAFNNIDLVSDFDTVEGDTLNVADILTGYDPLADLIADFVQITDNGTDSFLAVDADGGANNFVQIATLGGITGLTDENALEASGNLVGI